MLEAQETENRAPRSREGKLEDRGALDSDPEDDVRERKRESERTPTKENGRASTSYCKGAH